MTATHGLGVRREEASPALSVLPDAVCLRDAAPPEPVEHLAHHLVLRGINLIAGEAGSGKSTSQLAMFGAIAGGYPVFEHFPTGDPRPVLLVSEEDERDVIHEHLLALIKGHRWDADAVLGNFHVHALDGVLLDDLRWQAKLRAEARALDAAIIGFDPLTKLMQGSTSSNDDAAVVTRFWLALVAEGIAVSTVHHVAKPKEGFEKNHRILGAVDWFNTARLSWWVDGRDTGCVLVCLKASRIRKPAPITVTRSVTADPANDATWISATMTANPTASTGDSLSDTDLATLGVIVKAINAPNSTDLRGLVRKTGCRANNDEINGSRAALLAADLIRWEMVGKAKAWHPTDKGRAAYARSREGQHAP